MVTKNENEVAEAINKMAFLLLTESGAWYASVGLVTEITGEIRTMELPSTRGDIARIFED